MELVNDLKHIAARRYIGHVISCENDVNGPAILFTQQHADDESLMDIGLCLHCIGKCTLAKLLLKLRREDIQQFIPNYRGTDTAQKE